MTVSPGRVTAGRPGTLTFSYAAGARGLAATGEVSLTVPAGWTAPSQVPGTVGYTTSRPGTASVSGRHITVTGITLRPGQVLTITYRPAAAPRAAGTSVFPSFERSTAAGRLTALAASPSVIVAGTSPSHLPVLLPVVLATATAAVLWGIRFLRRGPQPLAASAVQVVPHAGPPGTVSVQDSGTEATHTVRIEPRSGAAVTTIEETRP